MTRDRKKGAQTDLSRRRDVSAGGSLMIMVAGPICSTDLPCQQAAAADEGGELSADLRMLTEHEWADLT